MTIDEAKQIYRNLLTNNTLPADAVDALSVLSSYYHITRVTDYPINIINLISDIKYNELSDDQVKCFDYICKYNLVENEYTVIQYRFRDQISLNTIAGIFKISKQRVVQVEKLAINKLKAIFNDPSFVFSYKIIQRRLDIRNKYVEKIRLKAEYSTDNDTVENVVNKMIELSDEILNKEINILCLSARSYNALRRYGYNKIKDLYKLTYDELTHMNALGTASVKEVEEKLLEYGIIIRRV